MQRSFDTFEYFSYLRSRWRFIASCAVIASAGAGIVSLLMPARYTATATILIDAPAGNDPRAATAVSPVYLESLKTYERFASSDTLFVRAIDRFRLREEAGQVAADSLKRRVLKVTKPRDTKLLEINVTLTNPQKAQGVAQFLAEETANLNQMLSRRSDEEVTAEARRLAEAARGRLEEAEKSLALESGSMPGEALQTELDGLIELKTRLYRELVEADADAADFAAQEQTERSQPSRELAGVAARRQVLRKEVDGLAKSIAEKQRTVAQHAARLDRLEAERRAARSVYDAAATRLNDSQFNVGIRGERLKIIDPGIVPQRPTSPNVVLNVLSAVLVALISAGLYVTAGFGSLRRMPERADSIYR